MTATELNKRIWFTLGALVVWAPTPPAARHRSHDPAGCVPSPGDGILGMFDMLAGGAFSRMTIFALSVMPYISAAIFLQLLTAFWPYFAQMKESAAGRKKIDQYTRYVCHNFSGSPMCRSD